MPRSSAASRLAPPFLYVGGDASLDFVNTVDWLTDGPANERLSSYARLTRWAEDAAIVARRDARALRQRASDQPGEADAALAAAHALRSVLRRVFHETAHGSLSRAACSDFDGWLAEALARLGVATGSRADQLPAAARWHWRGAEEQLGSPLWPVTWSAAKLLTSDEADRIRVCAGPECGWVYVDRSRNGLRRWCQMSTCGTAAKTRRRRGRRPA